MDDGRTSDEKLHLAIHRGLMDAAERGLFHTSSRTEYVQKRVRAWAVGELEARTTTLRDEREQMWNWLGYRAQHRNDCDIQKYPMEDQCSCGLSDLAALGSGDPERNEGGQ